jgi:hypothetical protein
MAINEDFGAHLDAVKDEEQLAHIPWGLVDRKARAVRPVVPVPDGCIQKILLVERVADLACGLQVGDQIAGHDRRDGQLRRRRASFAHACGHASFGVRATSHDICRF